MTNSRICDRVRVVLTLLNDLTVTSISTFDARHASTRWESDERSQMIDYCH